MLVWRRKYKNKNKTLNFQSTSLYTCCCWHFACDTIYLVGLCGCSALFLPSPFYCFLTATLLIRFLCCPYSLTSPLLLLFAIACHIFFFIVATSCCLLAALTLPYSCTMRSYFFMSSALRCYNNWFWWFYNTLKSSIYLSLLLYINAIIWQ